MLWLSKNKENNTSEGVIFSNYFYFFMNLDSSEYNAHEKPSTLNMFRNNQHILFDTLIEIHEKGKEFELLRKNNALFDIQIDIKGITEEYHCHALLMSKFQICTHICLQIQQKTYNYIKLKDQKLCSIINELFYLKNYQISLENV